jgi:Protein of unknown function (DUF3667)
MQEKNQKKEKFCKNCDYPLRPEDKFCSQCGQNAKTKRLNLKQTRKDLLKRFINTDVGIIHLTKSLALKPGIVALEYFEGKRKRYYEPLKYLTLSVGISVLATEYFDLMSAKQPEANPVSVFVARHINLVFMFSVPAAALFSWLLFRKKRYNYAEHLALHAFLGGFRTVLFMLVFAPFVVVFRDHYHTVLLFYFGLWTVYVAWANRQLFEEAMWLTFLKTLALIVLVQIVISICIFVVAGIYFSIQ